MKRTSKGPARSMLIHLVGGFLGSGKTTAIVEACRLLMRRGITVGVVTNDQGKNLVDTAFVRAAGAAAAEVSGGCFCCNLPDFERRLAELEEAAAPQVVFAEPVGSCTDLVATIARPLARRGAAGWAMGSLTVVTDIRLLRRRLHDEPLPFSSEVIYIFDTQLDEAELIIVNKSDLVPAERGRGSRPGGGEVPGQAGDPPELPRSAKRGTVARPHRRRRPPARGGRGGRLRPLRGRRDAPGVV